jgi:uncharacterized protein YfaS (alpha-2-macroglobulin family)
LRTPVEQAFDFQTCGPLAVVEHRVGWEEQVGPEAPWQIRFSNPLDPKTVERKDFHIEPAMPELQLALWEQTLIVYGWRQANTDYRLTLPAGLRDMFGQTLSTPTTLSFQVGRADSRVFVGGSSRSWDTILLRPAHDTWLPVGTVNHRALSIRIHSVQVEDWPVYSDPALWRSYSSYVGYGEHRKKALDILDWLADNLPGKCVVSDVVELDGHDNELVETRIDLQPALQGPVGHALIVIQALDRLDRDPLVIWCQMTRIGLHAFAERDGVLVWTTDLQTGAPLENVVLRLEGTGIEGRSGPDGLAWLPRADPVPRMLVARRDNDAAILPDHYRDWPKRQRRQRVVWCAMDGRGIYRPGEEIRLKAWPRLWLHGQHGTVHLLDRPYQALCQLVLRYETWIEQRVDVDPRSGLDVRFTLPAEMPSGRAAIRLVIPEFEDDHHYHDFEVEEYREPEFEVVLTASEGPHIAGAQTLVSAQARYYSGGPLPGAEIAWSVKPSQTDFHPPGFERFSFGKWLPWWIYRPHGVDGQRGVFLSDSLRAETSLRGQHTVRIDFSRIEPTQPIQLTIQAAVTDINRQCWAVEHSIMIHPAELYVGLCCPQILFRAEVPILIDLVVTDPRGAIVAGQTVELELHRVRQVLGGVGNEPTLHLVEVIPMQSGHRPQPIALSPQPAGHYRLIASVRDSAGRRGETTQDFWVAGGVVSVSESEFVSLIPNKERYEPGEFAEILVQCSFFPAEALLTVRREGILHSETLTLREPSQTIRLPITCEHYPEIHLRLDLVGQNSRSGRVPMAGTPDEGEPAHATGCVTLKVPPRARELSVAVRAQEPELQPGERTEIEVSVHRADGAAAGSSEVVIMVVDEAVLALSGYQTPDPLAEMYREIDGKHHAVHSRTNLLSPTITWHALGQFREPPGAGYVSGFSRGLLDQPITEPAGGNDVLPAAAFRVRDTFRAVALFVPSAVTDSRGHVAVPITLPHNVTRYRVMVLAAWGSDHFGRGEAAITTRLPLTIRPSPPRFAHAGDRLELAAIVQNQTDRTQEVAVAARAQHLCLAEPHGWHLELPSHQRAEVRFVVGVDQAGTARVQIAASATPWSDAVAVDFPVRMPVTTESFALYSHLDEGTHRVPLILPSDTWSDGGQLKVTLSSTGVAALTDAVWQLLEYPFNCAEQLASRILGLSRLIDVPAILTGLASDEEIRRRVERDVAQLRSLQNADGGFPFWRRGEPSLPLPSIHAAHALFQLQDWEDGSEESVRCLAESLEYLTKLPERFRESYPREVRWYLEAYALHVRSLWDTLAWEEALELLEDADLSRLPIEAAGWLLQVLCARTDEHDKQPDFQRQIDRMMGHLNNRARQSAATAYFTHPGEATAHSRWLLLTEFRGDAVALDALLAARPDHPLVSKLVRGLLQRRRHGHWGTTLDNVFVLRALLRYFAAHEPADPNFEADVWLAGKCVGQCRLDDPNAPPCEITMPIRELPAGQTELLLHKQGRGRMHYRLALELARQATDVGALDRGFRVSRVYESVEAIGDIRRNVDGSWYIRAGALVRVRVTVTTPLRRYHVALVDPLPGGLEPLNPALAVTPMPDSPASVDEWGSRSTFTWFEHQNLRDDRAEAFASVMQAGLHAYSYLVRATTLGHFAVPPPKVEEMYHPETFGRGASDRVVVE